jgi:hypothetical protein
MTRVLFSLFFVATLCATGRALAAGPERSALRAIIPRNLPASGLWFTPIRQWKCISR